MDVGARFWSKVQRNGPDDCWPWQAAREPLGYGRFWIGPRPGRMWYAHRVAFVLTNGYAPPVVMHRCDNPPCCNPAHLQAGTQKENVHDARFKNRMDDSTRRVGEAHPNAKLTAADVAEIRRRYVPRRGVSALAAEFGVSRGTITQVATGRWRTFD